VQVAIPKTGSTSMLHAVKNIHMELYGNLDNLLLYKGKKITPDFYKKYNLDQIGDTRGKVEKHLSALQIKYIIGEEPFNNCFKFSIVRNSWSYMVSRYHFTHVDYEPDEETKKKRQVSRNFHNLEFDTWVHKRWKRFKKNTPLSSQLSKLTDLDGNLIVDYVGQLENIQESLNYICNHVGLQRMEMPYVNHTRKIHYSELYTAETKEMVEEIHKKDIDFFGFEFEQK